MATLTGTTCRGHIANRCSWVYVLSMLSLPLVNRITAYPSLKKNKKPAQREADFLLRVFSEGEAERRTQLPVAHLFQASGQNPVCRPSLLARQLLLAYLARLPMAMPQVAVGA